MTDQILNGYILQIGSILLLLSVIAFFAIRVLKKIKNKNAYRKYKVNFIAGVMSALVFAVTYIPIIFLLLAGLDLIFPDTRCDGWCLDFAKVMGGLIGFVLPVIILNWLFKYFKQRTEEKSLG